MSPSKYVREAINNVETYCREKLKESRRLPMKGTQGPWPRDYAIELDTSKELDRDLASYFQSLVGVLHWIVELGRVDIITEVSTLASQMAMPREGHLDAALHVFGYLKTKHNS